MNIIDENNLLNVLNTSLVTRNWNDLYDSLNPKSFGIIKSRQLFKVLAKIAEIIVNEENDIPDKLKIILLKCLGNSCLNVYTHADYESNNTEYGKYCKKLYANLAEDRLKFQYELQEENICFPYNGIAEWTVDYIILNCDVALSEEQIQVLRLCIQFLCNLFTFACNNRNLLQCKRIKNYLNGTTFQNAIIKFICFEDISVARAACMFIHNALKKFGQDYFTWNDKIYVCSQLLKKVEDLQCAKDALLCLLNQENVFKSVYEDISMENKLHLLQIIHEEAQNVIYRHEKSDTGFTFCQKLIDFLSDRFCKRSDLILKTKDTYLNNFEPMEIIILLDILGVLTSEATDELYIIQNNRSLLINCCYLLKSLHMCGKESENYFTSIQRLSDVAPSTQKREHDLEHHPAFGFKAGLIRIIGNMSYKNKKCQDIIRETDTIPLLFDCCNIDARNPLIMQWIILAIRNLCEENLENQEIIRNSTKIGVMDNTILKEMGLTLQDNENGKSIGIVPLL
ncbi:ataxin-10-like [Vespa mandarinia]|uniref:ataxin-10-like n=1 Tax=Vespa mandarinia TaxID=7446 RepID=UPI00161AA2F5|nr:ataxin-10-like [Vespa mandarinia]XP_035730638.1 ataxin-10-like [Vespa mandarinia]